MKRRLTALWTFLAVLLVPTLAAASTADPFRNGWNVYIGSTPGCYSYSWGGSNLDQLTVSLSDGSGCALAQGSWAFRPHETWTVQKGPGKVYFTADVFVLQATNNNFGVWNVEAQDSGGAVLGSGQFLGRYILAPDKTTSNLGNVWPIGQWFTLLQEWDSSQISSRAGETIPIQLKFLKTGKYTVTVKNPHLTYTDPRLAVPEAPTFDDTVFPEGGEFNHIQAHYRAGAGTGILYGKVWGDTSQSDVQTFQHMASEGTDYSWWAPTEWETGKPAGWYTVEVWASNGNGLGPVARRRFRYKPDGGTPITAYPTWGPNTQLALERPDGAKLVDLGVDASIPDMADAVLFRWEDETDGSYFERTSSGASGSVVQARPDGAWLAGRDGRMFDVSVRGVNAFYGYEGPSISAVFQYDPVREPPPEEAGIEVIPWCGTDDCEEVTGGLWRTTSPVPVFEAWFRGSTYQGQNYEVWADNKLVKAGPVPAPTTGEQISRETVTIPLDYGRHSIFVRVKQASTGGLLGQSAVLEVERIVDAPDPGEGGGFPGFPNVPGLPTGGDFMDMVSEWFGWFGNLYRMFPGEMTALMLFGLALGIALRAIGR